MFCRPGDTVRFLVQYNAAATSLGKTGLTPTISVNEGTTNKVTVASATAMTAVDPTNQPGLYYYDYTVTSTFFGTVVAQATTSDTTVTARSLAMLYISVPWITYTANGTASAGAANSITLAGASATDNIYNGEIVWIIAGTGAGQARIITAYNGTTKVATVVGAWATTPDNTSVFSVNPLGTVNLASILNSLVSTSTAQLGVNVVNIGGSASQGAAGYVGTDQNKIANPTATVDLSGTTIKNVDNAISNVTTVGSVTAPVTVGTNNDKTGYTLTAGEHTLISGTDVPNGMTAQGYTTTRAGYLDTLNGLVANIWGYVTRTLTSAGSIASDVWSYAVRTLTQTSVTIVSNFDVTTKALSLNAGDAYLASLGTQQDFNLTGFPDLTGVNVYFSAYVTSNGTPYTKLMTVVSPTGTQTVRLELTATESLYLKSGKYDIRADYLTTSPTTLVKGHLTIYNTIQNPLP